MSVRLGILGESGRMGQFVKRLIETEFTDRAKLAATASQGSPLEPLLGVDAVIDFSSPSAAKALAELALKKSGKLPAFVVGSTGWTADESKTLEKLAEKTAVLAATNFSTGVLAILEILKTASPMLNKLGYTPVLVETHHRRKKDAPSGTAITMQKTISSEPIQTHAIRGGEIIGDHEVTFYGPGDHLTMGHFAQDRSIFARGAIDVALWLAGKPPGTYSMSTFFKERYL